MKLHPVERTLIKSEELVEKEFSIKTTAKAFTILSSALYSDKILAIVRELSCNALDAHRAAGRENEPFEIKLPTAFDMTFAVKDFGVGLNHEQVMELYTTYFDSTKDDSDDYVGALGLGSKSPFSYVQTFSVESRYDGIRRLYTAYINERGVPSITKMGEEATGEVNGLTISLAVKQGDAEKFDLAARRALTYFLVQPKIKGQPDWKANEVTYATKGTNWGVRKTSTYGSVSGAQAIQGPVAYPIDREILMQSGLPPEQVAILGLSINFVLPMGSVEIAPSREALSYTKQTITNLISIVDVAAKEMRSAVEAEFAACKSMWEARLMFAEYDNYRHVMHSLFAPMHRAKPFTYKGVVIDDGLSLDLSKIKGTALLSMYMPSYARRGKLRPKVGGHWQPNDVTQLMSITLQPGHTVLVDDLGTSKGIMTEYLADHRPAANTGNTEARCLVIKATDRKNFKQNEVDAILKMLGDPEYKLVSSLSYQKAKKATTTYRARKNDEVLKWDGFPENGGYRRDQIRRTFSRLCWTGMKVDLNEKKQRFFVELERFAIVRGGAVQSMFDQFLETMIKVGIVSKDADVYGLNEKQAFRLKSNKNWINLFSHCEKQFAEMNKNGDLSARFIAHNVMNEIGSGMARHIILDWKNVESKIADGSFKKHVQAIVDVYEQAKAVKIDASVVFTAGQAVNKKFPTECKDKSTKLLTNYSDMLDKHSMLRLVDWSRVYSKDVDMIIAYINFVAQS